jgi:hypothetical protein
MASTTAPKAVLLRAECSLSLSMVLTPTYLRFFFAAAAIVACCAWGELK